MYLFRGEYKMEPLFTNKSIRTKQTFFEISKGTYPYKKITILYICFGLLLILSVLIDGTYFYFAYIGLICILYPLNLFWRMRYSATNSYNQFLQLYHCDTESINNFYEDHFDVHVVQNGSNVTLNYSQVAKVFETKNLFFLMLSTGIGFMLDKQGFEGITAEEFGVFIRTRAVGEGKTELRKRNRKIKLIRSATISVIIAVGVLIGFFGQSIESLIPKTFKDGDYSIKLTSAFRVNDGEWYNHDATVYCFNETSDELSKDGHIYGTAADYLQDTNKSYEIDSVVKAVSDKIAWTAYTVTDNGSKYYNYDYVIEYNGTYWYSEFYCLQKDAYKYKPLFEKWAQTIKISSSR